jgi:hypothetical protein
LQLKLYNIYCETTKIHINLWKKITQRHFKRTKALEKDATCRLCYPVCLNQIATLRNTTKPAGIKIDVDYPLCTVVCVDDQRLLAENEQHLQKGGFSLNKILEIYSTEIPENKSKVVAMAGK